MEVHIKAFLNTILFCLTLVKSPKSKARIKTIRTIKTIITIGEFKLFSFYKYNSNLNITNKNNEYYNTFYTFGFKKYFELSD